jgi:hypothetical protein
MGTIARPTGSSLARGTHTLEAGELTLVVEGIMEAQSRCESALRLAHSDPFVAEHIALALEELRGAQQKLSGARFHPAWDGSFERRRCIKAAAGAYGREVSA